MNGVSKSPAIYDIKKLNWYNKEYIKNFSHEDLMKHLKPFLKFDLSKFSDEDQRILIDSIRGNLDKFEDINDSLVYFFEEVSITDDLKKFLDEGKAVLDEIMKRFDDFNFEDPGSMKDLINKIGEDLSLKGKKLFFPIRIAVSSRTHGPDLGVVFYLLGKEKCHQRLSKLQ